MSETPHQAHQRQMGFHTGHHQFLPNDADVSFTPSLRELQRDVLEWSAATFSHHTPAAKIAHLKREVIELEENPASAEEMADCLLLLAGVAEMAGVDLLDAAVAKLAKNRLRKWGPPDAEGVSSHIAEGKEEA